MSKKVEGYLDKYLPTTCCGCCEPRTGVLIVSILGVVSAIFALGSPSVPSGSSMHNWTIVLNLFSLTLSGIGAYGAYKRHFMCTKIYAYANFVCLFLNIITMIALAAVAKDLVYHSCMSHPNPTEEVCSMVADNANLFVLVVALVEIPLNVYVTLVTWSFYRTLASPSLGETAAGSGGGQYFPANDDDIAVSNKV